MSRPLFLVSYPSSEDFFSELRDVLTEREYRIAKALIPDMKLIEVHCDNRIYNDSVSRENWRNMWGK